MLQFEKKKIKARNTERGQGYKYIATIKPPNTCT